MKRKKIIAAFFTFFLLVALGGCGKLSAEEEKDAIDHILDKAWINDTSIKETLSYTAPFEYETVLFGNYANGRMKYTITSMLEDGYYDRTIITNGRSASGYVLCNEKVQYAGRKKKDGSYFTYMNNNGVYGENMGIFLESDMFFVTYGQAGFFFDNQSMDSIKNPTVEKKWNKYIFTFDFDLSDYIEAEILPKDCTSKAECILKCDDYELLSMKVTVDVDDKFVEDTFRIGKIDRAPIEFKNGKLMYKVEFGQEGAKKRFDDFEKEYKNNIDGIDIFELMDEDMDANQNTYSRDYVVRKFDIEKSQNLVYLCTKENDEENSYNVNYIARTDEYMMRYTYDVIENDEETSYANETIYYGRFLGGKNWLIFTLREGEDITYEVGMFPNEYEDNDADGVISLRCLCNSCVLDGRTFSKVCDAYCKQSGEYPVEIYE